jgi:hypothetical protein
MNQTMQLHSEGQDMPSNIYAIATVGLSGMVATAGLDLAQANTDFSSAFVGIEKLGIAAVTIAIVVKLYLGEREERKEVQRKADEERKEAQRTLHTAIERERAKDERLLTTTTQILERISEVIEKKL